MFYSQISSGLAAHDMLVMTYACGIGSERDKTRVIRKLHGIDQDKLIQDALRVDWSPVYGALDVNDMFTNLNSALLRLLDVHAPEMVVPLAGKSVNSVKRWMTDDVRRAVIERDVSYAFYRSDPTDDRLASYRALRNRVTPIIRTTKYRFFEPWFDKRLGCKRIWDNLRSLGIVTSKKDCVEPAFTALEFNLILSTPVEGFSTVPSVVMPPSRPRLALSDLMFSFVSVSQLEVSESIMKVKSNAVGLDGVPIRTACSLKGVQEGCEDASCELSG